MAPTPTKAEALSIPAVSIGYWRLCWLLRPGELTAGSLRSRSSMGTGSVALVEEEVC